MHDFSPLGDAKPSMAAFNLPPGLKSRPKTALREVGPARLVEPPEEAVDDSPWDRVFVGVHYAEGLSRLFQSGLTQRRKHLLRELPRDHLAVFHGKDDRTVETMRYSPKEQLVAINKTQFFKPVPQPVWHFHIGGYQVINKYLRSRQERKLGEDFRDGKLLLQALRGFGLVGCARVSYCPRRSLFFAKEVAPCRGTPNRNPPA